MNGTEQHVITWLGHASALLEIPTAGRPLNILFDPVFSERCSPVSFLGLKRIVPSPCNARDLSTIDICVISHNHYDHLDRPSIIQLERSHSKIRYFVPSGVKQTLVKWGLEESRVSEHDWWTEETIDIADLAGHGMSFVESEKISLLPPSSSPHRLRVICTPTQHNSGRSLLDQNKTLWASWLVVSERNRTSFKCFFGGDTGFQSRRNGPTCTFFSNIRKAYGSPDLALLPIASGSVLPLIERLTGLGLDHAILTSSVHCTPGDATNIHKILGAKRSLAIHHSTFTTKEAAQRTTERFIEATTDQGISNNWDDEGSFTLCQAGDRFAM